MVQNAGFDFQAVSATPQARAGTRATDDRGDEWVHVQAQVAIPDGGLCALAANGMARPTVSGDVTSGGRAAGKRGAVAQQAIAVNMYGWLKASASGDGRILCGADCPAGTLLHVTGTPGAVDDPNVALGQVNGLFIGTSQGAGTGVNTTGSWDGIIIGG